MTRYVLLCRHGPHRKGSLTPVKVDGEDVYPTDAIGERLRDQLNMTLPDQESIRIAQIWCANTEEAKGTLRRLVAAIGQTSDDKLTSATDTSGSRTSIELKDELKPQNFLQAGLETKLVKKLRDGPPDQNGNAILLVGHQPQLSWIADKLLRAHRSLLRRQPPVPIDRAGLVCVVLDGGTHKRDRLAWAISFDDKEVAQEVREKIRLKMDTAKLLTGALTLGLTVIFGVLFDKEQFDGLGDRRWAVQVSAALLLAAAALYFATMYAYDGLLMPDRFWGERRPSSSSRRFNRSGSWLVERPPSSTAWVLYQNMMRVWRNLFTSASLLVGAAIALLGYGALRLRPWQALAVGVPTLLIVGFWVWWSRPILGSED
jgi:hypothetical protein